MWRIDVGDLVARCASLAALLEASAYPKPGNVHRTQDLPHTRYEHFLAGSVALGPATRELAMRGFDAAYGSAGWGDIGVGSLALKAVTETLNWQRGGNVNLGVILLFSPLAAAGGATIQDDGKVDVEDLRVNLKKILSSTTPDDAIAVYEAIRSAMTPTVLGEVEDLDVLDASSPNRIREGGLTLVDVFRRCAERDSICAEWISGFETTFATGYPYLKMSLGRSDDVNSAVVNTFLFILSRRPDSLIRRKKGIDKAVEVSERARLVLDEGGSSTERGRELLWQMDREFQRAGGGLNPGTTADLTASAIFVALLEGWRP